MRVSIVAPSSAVSEVELRLGVRVLEAQGFEPVIDSQVLGRHLFYAGTDQERALAFYRAAKDRTTTAVWSARGGYGATQLLPLLDELTRKKGKPPKKLLIGYSDSTALLEYVRARWGWRVLHAPMPGHRALLEINEREAQSLFSWIQGRPTLEPWSSSRLKQIAGKVAKAAIRAPLFGGNLTLWAGLAGTRYAFKGPSRSILFLEDVTESPSRIFRVVHQLSQAGFFKGVKAVLLGDFEQCEDKSPWALSVEAEKKFLKSGSIHFQHLSDQDRVPLRPAVSMDVWMKELWQPLSKVYGFSVWTGVPAGHGKRHCPLPLGAHYELSPSGELKLKQWDHLKSLKKPRSV